MKTILIVDDNESICNILYHYGKEAGYTMVIAHTGQEGLTYFTNYKPDVILLDVMLPDIDGFEVCQCIRKVSRVPILMITAKTADQDRVMGLDIGADDYILKPFSCDGADPRGFAQNGGQSGTGRFRLWKFNDSGKPEFSQSGR